MSTLVANRASGRLAKSTAAILLAVLPVSAALLSSVWPRWMVMWSLALSIYGGCKWISFVDRPRGERISLLRSMGYLLFWPGMDAAAFFETRRPVPAPKWGEWLAALTKTLFGCLLLDVGVRLLNQDRLLAGWIGIAGLAFLFHFGLFHLLSLCWRRCGVDARPIMDAPIKASSLADFWGRRWNAAFRDLSHRYVFRPLIGQWGATAAMLAAFVVSGLIHDLVISFPSDAGFGLPTAYFTIQGFGLLFERSRWSKRIGLGSGITGWLYCAVVTILPVGLLFHPPFIERVVIPMLTAIETI
jgi:Membrane bound O-acyl transferase family